ncbi:MAG: RNA-binding protein [Armatimonadota bacterium]|nr:RNA-binding protein [Armatimonadota bacterium]MDR7436142.1 RNA-binding protein [Armatimonadota bacterium]MDR7472021.1 RNA-binding protein [Armatimonadota bacterium]MDR7506695.1 RNA-binding protein [Armatimonadota bacterium]MDR7508677.1 RNA-binding protein [Armatimonadota bacterium]
MSTKRLFVGNLSYDTTEEELRGLFTTWGPVSDTRLLAERGFGFVEIPAERMAEAIAAMHGKEFKGRTLIVNEARPRPQGPSGGRGYGGGGGRPGGWSGGGGGERSGRGGGGRGRRRERRDRRPRW